MTDTSLDRSTTTPSGAGLLAILGVAYALAMAAVATWWQPDGDQGLREYLITVAIILAAAGIVFGLVVRGATGRGARTRAVVLAALALVAVVVFWSGLPFILAAAAAACALPIARAPERLGASGVLALAAAALAVVASTVSSFVG
ncbi:hypothetical protein [Kineosporia sp. A_224]|uniref:hypothetical protein n=1 Tax=Kineosporia sp. A_224 TaxID=1962180 RepID=UPI00130403B1|nr:hypothetical protein [Kineosporia sp. A_224]